MSGRSLTGNLGGNAESLRPNSSYYWVRGLFYLQKTSDTQIRRSIYKEDMFMLDIKFLRNNPEIVKENIKKKFQ
ncbi:MAG: hypothetical protein IJ411_01800, partial [Oscillospiraceae bacterium]|nr:hypothetical protein [Oscillospiraceae bacterium]